MGRGPLVQPIEHPEYRQAENGACDGEKADDVGHRPLGHESPKYEHSQQRQAAADQRQHGKELLVKLELVYHPPRGARAGSR